MSYLQTRMRWLIAQASLLPEASAQNLESERIGQSKPSDVAPRSAGVATHDQFIQRQAQARSDRELEQVVRWAEQELERIRRTPQPANGMCEPGTLAWKREIAERVSEAKTGDQVGSIARRYMISRATAYRYCQLYGKEAA